MIRRLQKTRILVMFLLFALWLGILTGATHAIPPVQRTVLSNQLVLLASEDHSLPFVTLQVLVDSGSWRDPPGQEGSAYLTARSLLSGTLNRSVNQVNEDLDFIGADLKASCSARYHGIRPRRHQYLSCHYRGAASRARAVAAGKKRFCLF